MLTSPVVRSLEQHTLHCNFLYASSGYAMLSNLRSKFALKDLGTLHYFLGMEVNHINEGITLTQKRYATEII